MAVPGIDFAKFLPYDELRRTLKALVSWKPRLARLHVIGKSPGGREIPLVEVTNSASGRGEGKPGYLVHANIHAAEVSGSAASVYLIHHLLSEAGSDDRISDVLDRIVFYVIPRISVDGAEECLVRCRSVRSRDRVTRQRNAFYPKDLDGDGRILTMRWPDPHGTHVAFEDDPNLLLRRLPDDPPGRGAVYRVAVEGLIHEWDGGEFSGGNVTDYDFNRNWGANWLPAHLQYGAGRYGFSEPEMRAIADFAHDHPNLFGMLGFHTGPNCILRPPATKSDSDIDREDVAYFRDMARVGSEITGFPARSVAEYRHERTHPNKLHGHFTEWAYEHLGLYGFEIELGTLFNSAGISTEQTFRCTQQEYREFERQALAWHYAHPGAGAFVEWKPFRHPQLGRVEIGGWTPVARANIVPEEREETWHKAALFLFDLAAQAPRLAVRETVAAPLGGGLYKVRCLVANEGGLPTHVSRMGARFSHVKGVAVRLDLGPGVERVCGSTYCEIGHLAAQSGTRELEWVVRAPRRGKGWVAISARAPRAGAATARVRLGGRP